jgi:Fe-S-cluster containining protein
MSAVPHNPCATCGACCRSYIVPVCGYDVWRISASQRLAPEQFLVPIPQNPPRSDGFLLEKDAPPYGLALDKRGRFHPNQPCIFLVELKGGHSRCGIYAHRPTVCQAYPMTLRDGETTQYPDALCPPGSWPEAAVRRPSWREAIARRTLHFAIYEDVVSRWNARVLAAPPGTAFSLFAFYDYLINVYDRLDALNCEVGAPALDEIQRTWGSDPADSNEPRPLWLDYHAAVRQMLVGFYADRVA